MSYVAPLAGAWIEILGLYLYSKILTVAPLAGAWIEMIYREMVSLSSRSLPSRERGLKSVESTFNGSPVSRSPRGSVD